LTEGESNNELKTKRIDRNTVMQLFQVLNEYFPEIRTLSDDDKKLLFAILDKDGSSTISEEEFMDFASVMMIEFVKSSVYTTFVEMRFPEFYVSQVWQRFCRVVKSNYFEYTIDIVLVLNAAVVSVQSYPELSGDEVHLDPKYWDGNIDTIWVRIFFLLVFWL
jgi:two pore calcium channel protein